MTAPVYTKKSRMVFLWAIFGALAVMSVVFQIWLQEIRKDTRADINLFAEKLPGSIFEFERSIGYSGLIHHFKNFVLRPDEEKYHLSALRSFEQAEVQLNLLEELAEQAKVQLDADTIRETLEQYRNHLELVVEASGRGLSPTEVDDYVRIDDGPATAAFDQFLRSVRVAFRDKVGGQVSTLSFILNMLAILSFALPAIVGMAAFLRQRDQKTRLTEVEQLNHSLEEKNLRLTQSNQSLSDLAYVASHDLRTPMRAIANHARFLIEDHAEAMQPAVQQRLARMETLCAQADVMVAKLHQYARIDRNNEIVEVDCARLLDQVQQEIRDLIDDGRAVVKQETPLPTVAGDPGEIATVFRHLILNGLHFNTSDIPTVRVGYHGHLNRNGKMLTKVFYVTDNGIGIDSELQADAFRIFKRLHQSGDFAKGFGTGLAFVKKAVQNHDGRIWIESSPDQGTTFFFTLAPEETPRGKK